MGYTALTTYAIGLKEARSVLIGKRSRCLGIKSRFRARSDRNCRSRWYLSGIRSVRKDEFESVSGVKILAISNKNQDSSRSPLRWVRPPAGSALQSSYLGFCYLFDHRSPKRAFMSVMLPSSVGLFQSSHRAQKPGDRTPLADQVSFGACLARYLERRARSLC